MEDDNTESGAGEALTVEQAATAYAKTLTKEAPEGQSEAEDEVVDDTTADDEPEATDEEAEADDGDPDEEGQAEDQDEEEPESDQGRFVASNGKVRLPDGTVSTVNDLIQGNLRDRDYRQKTMEAAEVKKTSEAKLTAATQLETQLIEQREQVATLLRTIMPAKPDSSLAQTDPFAYNVQKAQHEEWLAYVQDFDQQNLTAKQADEQKKAQSRQEKGNAELATLVEKVPALKDEKKFTAFVKDSLEHGAQYGFTPDELRDAIGYDHRMAMVLREAIQWRKLQASKANVTKKVENRPPIAKGGKRLNPAESRARTTNEAFTRLKKSGSVDDAAAAWLASTRK